MLVEYAVRSISVSLLTGLHYFTCAVIAASFLGAHIVGIFTLQPGLNRHTSKSLRYKVALSLSSTIAITFLAQSVLFASDTLSDLVDYPSQDTIIHALLQTLTWTSLSLVLFNSAEPAWRSFITVWTVALLLEVPLIILSYLSHERLGRYANCHRIIQCLRIVLLVVLSATALSTISHSKVDKDKANEDETQSLIGRNENSSPATALANGHSYHSIEPNGDIEPLKDTDLSEDDGDEDSETAEYLGEERKKRIRDEGGWLNYMKEYVIFWPYVWPTRNRRFQLYFLVLGLSTLGERALNVLAPRQWGILVDSMYDSAHTGQIPWKEIFLWIFYEVLTSHASGLASINQLLENRIANWSHLQLSVAAFDHVMGLPMSWHDEKGSGEVIKAVEQAGSLNQLLRTIAMDSLPVILDLIVACWYLTYLLDAYAVVIVIFVGLSFIFITYYLTTVLQRSRRAAATKGRAESRLLYEMVSNWATVSYFNRRQHEQVQLKQTVSDAVAAGQFENDISVIMFGAQNLCEIVGRLLITILASYRVAKGVIPVGNFVAVETYWNTIMFPLWMLGHSYRQLSSNLIDAERLLELFKTKSDVTDGPLTLPDKLGGGKVEFSNVNFEYRPQHPVLEDFSFTAEPGQTVALVGETGSGKSTTLKLLMRFYDVKSGSVKIDGHNVCDVTVDSLREVFGFVPQNAALFNTSILDNVRYGRLGATEQEVHEACKAAAIHDKILSFPDGYNTKVGERGVKLSGGELQRVAIARVILKDPKIVLLDEATSALDTNTEGKIQEALRNLTAGRTTIVIAHRLSTVTSADQILVLDQGKIVERGSHSELLLMGGRYVELWQKQTQAASTTAKDGESTTRSGAADE